MTARERLRLLAPYTIILLVVPVAAVIEPVFFRASNLQNVARSAAFLAVVALGQLVVIIGRGLDLSVGGVITTSSLLMVHFAGTAEGSLLAGIAWVVAVALAIGILNGVMVAFRRVPAILATLGTLFLVQGVSLWLTEGRSRGRVPDALVAFGAGRIGPIPVPVVVAAAVAVLMAVVLYRSPYGRAVYATGLNPEATALAGVPTRLVHASTFVVAALAAALAGLMLSGFVGFYDRTLGVGYDLDSIAAVVLGGASLLGGRGYVVGTLAAVVGLAGLDNLLLLQGVGESYQLIGKGIVLFAAVLFTSLVRRASSSPAGKQTEVVTTPPERNHTTA
ncbi:MAG: ABC transporter permease [Actinomycetota bacterium]